jgi:hypothetical protein
MTRSARPTLDVLWSTGGLVIWAAHFTAIYATTALACERGLDGTHLLGLPFVPAMVAAWTLLALGGLGLMMRGALAGLGAPLDEGGEAEPRFTRWFALAGAALAALAVLFQAVPAMVLPACA